MEDDIRRVLQGLLDRELLPVRPRFRIWLDDVQTEGLVHRQVSPVGGVGDVDRFALNVEVEDRQILFLLGDR